MRTTNTFIFRRPALAERCCDSLEGIGLVDNRQGLFMATPKRTGKSTFLREDLLPAMQQRGWRTIYLDLRASPSKDPAFLMMNAITAKMTAFAEVPNKISEAAGLENVDGCDIFIQSPPTSKSPDALALADALEILIERGKAPVAIVIDEVEQALSTPDGMNVMFTLKAAREYLNQGENQQQRLLMVLASSSHDKLAQLVRTHTQLFFGSQVTQFPLLGKDFTDAYTDYVNPKLAASHQFAHADMFEFLKLIGHRPEMLKSIIGEIAINSGLKSLGEALKNGAETIKARMWQEMGKEFAGLSMIQRAVLETMILHGKSYTPFSDAAMSAYASLLQRERVSAPSVQAALAVLCEKGWVWRAAYEDYSLEDESLASWYRAEV